MGQKDVLDFLQKNKGRSFSAKEVSEKTGQGLASVSVNLNKLKTYRFISCVYADRTYRYISA